MSSVIKIDLGDHARVTVAALRVAVGDRGLALHAFALDSLADQIEAQTKPARILEPTAGTRVKATLKPNILGVCEFLHIKREPGGAYHDYHWVNLSDGNIYMWMALRDPRVIK